MAGNLMRGSDAGSTSLLPSVDTSWNRPPVTPNAVFNVSECSSRPARNVETPV